MYPEVWRQFCEVAAVAPDLPAVLQGDRVLSYGALRAGASAVARHLAAKGAGRGERAVIWAENSPEMATAVLGTLAAGAIPVFVNALAPASHATIAIERTGARAVFAEAAALARLGFDGLAIDLSRLPDPSGAADLVPPDTGRTAQDVASIVFTSGSTGLPKGVAQSHANLVWGCGAMGRILGLGAGERLLGAIPWAFDYGWGQLLSTFLLGAAHILPTAKGGIGACEAIARHRPTVLPGVPALFADLLRGVAPIRETPTDSIRVITNTGSKIPAGLFEDLLGTFPEARVSLNYGLTETYRSASLPFAQARQFPTSVGFALPGAAISVIDPEGRDCAPGEVGEVIHRGAGVFLGYWGDAEKTAQSLRPDPLHATAGIPPANAVFTGDLGWKDEGGRLYIEGRRDRQIKSMGVRVSPDEIERLIEATGLVKEVAVIGLPHDVVGQQVAAIITPKAPGVETLRALKKSARETMSPYMQPMIWREVDRLPRNPNGKID
ncbi:MAG: AMP-binding protein, partial [Rhodobacteraceae bacterium]|nr:AMP-binding protein [Paracoccaceae bacterium]